MSADPKITFPHEGVAYRPDIDGLRAVAVLGVLFFHAFPNQLTGGFVGVDVFFVISGFLITTLIRQDLAQGKFSVWNFYNRRIRRIFPSLLAMLLVVWSLGVALLMPNELRVLADSMVHSAYFANNFLLYSQAGYFDTQAELKPLLHLWSLAVEEQFYIAWPLLLWLATRLGPAGRQLAIVLFIGSLLASLALTPSHPIAAFFLPHFRAWELIAGALLAQHRPHLSHWARKLPGQGNWLPLTGLLLISFSYLLIGGDQPYPGWRALFPVAGTVMVILAEPQSWFSRRILASSPLVAVGLISYPLYLWHWPLFSFARILFGNPNTSIICGLTILSFGLAWVSYQYLEKPVRFSPWARQGIRWVPLTGIFLLLASGGLADFTRSSNGFPGRVNDSDWQALQWSEAQISDPSCHSELGIVGQYCLRSDTRPATVALLGDSHANHFFGGLALAMGKRGESVVQIPGPLSADADPLWANIDWLRRNQNIKTVFIAYHQGRINQKANPFDGTVERIVDASQKAGKQVVFLIDNPEFAFEPRLCTARPKIAGWLGAGNNREEQCSESREGLLRKRAAYNTFVTQLAARFPDLRLLDMMSPFCNDVRCSALSGNQLLFRDHHHLTTYGSEQAFLRTSFDWLAR